MPTDHAPWVTDDNVALLTDQYELAMLQAYWREGMHDDATFSLFTRRLPPHRNHLVAAGLGTVLDILEGFRFPPAALGHLRSAAGFDPDFVDWLGGLRFSGSVRAVPEGTPIFANEPLLEVTAPLPEAQLVETLIMNQIHHQTTAASKAARVVEAAGDRSVVDFGLRRMHGADAGIKAARAFFVAGVTATSNVLAGQLYGVPVAGTMAHSYVQAHDVELDAFREFARTFPSTVLLVDTYDTLRGVRRVVELARELGDDFGVRAIRLDSGDLGELARQSRQILDEAGLSGVGIFASGGLDEHAIAELVAEDSPITGFGVGTAMGVSEDAPSLDLAYKLTAYAGRGRVKLSPGKSNLPGRTQVFRRDGDDPHDVVGRYGEELRGRPLLVEVLREGRRTGAVSTDLEALRRFALQQRDALPDRIRGVGPAEPAWRVEVSPALEAFRRQVVHATRSNV